MTSWKGFMHRERSAKSWPRMTAGQKAALLDALSAIRDRAIAQEASEYDRAALHFAELVIARAVNQYPDDRSCLTCDFYIGTTCKHWNQEVPNNAVAKGCDHHKTEAAPF